MLLFHVPTNRDKDLTDEQRESDPATAEEDDSVCISTRDGRVEDGPGTVGSIQDSKIQSEPEVDPPASVPSKLAPNYKAVLPVFQDKHPSC